MKYIIYILVISFGLASCAFAQQDSIALKTKPPAYDTTYYRKYPDKLVVAMYVTNQQYELNITQNKIPDPGGRSTINYRSESGAVTGLSFDFDKFHLGFSINSVPAVNSNLKGNAQFSGLGFSIGGDKWVLETNYRDYSWFYDLNTNDTVFKLENRYYQNPTMDVRSFKLKFMYFFKHKKFSYQSAYSCTERQLRSALSPVFVANIDVASFSADSSFIPYYSIPFYGASADVNKLWATGYSVGGGLSGNLVFNNRFFINGTFLLGLATQYREYHHTENNSTQSSIYTNAVGDLRASIGYNNRNFFITFNVINDITEFDSSLFNLNGNFFSSTLTFGYRFSIKDPPVMKKVRENKIYKMF